MQHELISECLVRGSLGPARLFGDRALYHISVYAALIGAVLPIPIWLLGRRYKRSIWRMVHFGVLLNSVLNTPPATGANYASFFLAGFIFREYRQRLLPLLYLKQLRLAEYMIRRKAPDWWSRVGTATIGCENILIYCLFASSTIR